MRLSLFLHRQIGANMLHIARVAMLNSNQLRKLGISGASEELEKAKDLLDNSIRFVFFSHYISISQVRVVSKSSCYSFFELF